MLLDDTADATPMKSTTTTCGMTLRRRRRRHAPPKPFGILPLPVIFKSADGRTCLQVSWLVSSRPRGRIVALPLLVHLFATNYPSRASGHGGGPPGATLMDILEVATNLFLSLQKLADKKQQHQLDTHRRSQLTS